MSENILEVRGLTHSFKLSKKAIIKAVDDVSFDIKKGEIFGLVGESGSGKSTVARCIMSIYEPTTGEINYKGINICDPRQVKAKKKSYKLLASLFFRIPHPASTSV